MIHSDPSPDASTQPAKQPLAIIGMACRLPGAPDLRAFWELLRTGKDAITEVPLDRFDIDRIFHPKPGTPGKTYSRWGGFIDHVMDFDPSFFGISPREASPMDPQQRILLEVAFDAFEDAGLNTKTLRGSPTGVFIGACTNDVELAQSLDLKQVDIYSMNGALFSVIPGRISYFFDLRGPSLAVDTACSSSGAAFHLACQSVWSGECRMALAGGTNIILTPEPTLGFSQASMLALDGRCRVFDNEASGFTRSEGVAAVVVKRLDHALADRDPIYACILSSALNNDGRGTGMLMVPSREGQEQVIRRALEQASLNPTDVHYVEAHGTGTRVGDPIEAQALIDVYCQDRSPGVPLKIGSVKTNIGHTEATAGIAGVIKTALCLHHNTWVPSLHFRTPHTQIPWHEHPIQVQTQVQSPAGPAPLRAGVSSFGISGVNVHAIMESAPTPPTPSEPGDGWIVFTCSAQDEACLRDRLHVLLEHIQATPDFSRQDMLHLCYTLALRRTHLSCRTAVAVKHPEQLVQALAAVADRPSGAQMPFFHAPRHPKWAWIFPGQGTQWLDIGEELLRLDGPFRAHMAFCDQLIQSEGGWSLLDLLANPDQDRIGFTAVVQPAMVAIQCSLVQTLTHYGLQPDWVVGHSVGEISAVATSGMLSVEQAIQLALRRGSLMDQVRNQGGMIAVRMAREPLEDLLRSLNAPIRIASCNAPQTQVVSGSFQALDRLKTSLQQRNAAFKDLPVHHPFHSQEIQHLARPLREQLSFLTPRSGHTPVISSVTGTVMEGLIADAAYWGRNMTDPVQYQKAVETALSLGATHFLEIGKAPSLLGHTRQIARGKRVGLMTMLDPHKPEGESLFTTLGQAHACGFSPNWDLLFPLPGSVVHLPGYPWRRRFLPPIKTPHMGPDPASHLCRTTRSHPLLGHPINLPDPTWTTRFDALYPGFIAHHEIKGRVWFPAAGFLEMVCAAASQQFGCDTVHCPQVTIHRPLPLSKDQGIDGRTCLRPHAPELFAFDIAVRQEGQGDSVAWATCCSGLLSTHRSGSPERMDMEDLRNRCALEIPVELFYEQLANVGLQYGPSFRRVTRAWRGRDEGLVEFQNLNPAGDASPFFHDPCLLDAAMQALAVAVPEEHANTLFLPVSMERVRIRRAPQSPVMFAYAQRVRISATDENRFFGRIQAFDAEGEWMLDIGALEVRRAHLERAQTFDPESCLFHLNWQPMESPKDALKEDNPPNQEHWLLIKSGHENMDPADLLGDGVRQLHEVILPSPATFDAVDLDQWDAYGLACVEEALNALTAQGITQLNGIIHAAWCDAPKMNGTELTEAMASLPCLSLMWTYQAITRHQTFAFTPLWILTNRAQARTPQDEVNPIQSAIWGMGRVLIHEAHHMGCRLIDIHDPGHPSCRASLNALLRNPPNQDQLALTEGLIFALSINRRTSNGNADQNSAEPLKRPAIGPCRLEIPRPGLIDRLQLKSIRATQPGPGQVELQVKAAGLNFRDVLKTLGAYPSDLPDDRWLGDECCGVVTRTGKGVTAWKPGDTVFGVAPRSFADRTITRASLLARKPPTWSEVEAAGLPIAYLTAWYALVELARIRPGDRILIHSAATGVGLAAVHVARAQGCGVVATAGTKEKRDMLRDMGIPHVLDSRSLDYVEAIREITAEQGVQAVLSAQPGEFMRMNMKLLAPGGSYLDIGKRDIYSGASLDMSLFKQNRRYLAVDLAQVVQDQPELIQSMLRSMVDRVEAQTLPRLAVTVFPLEQSRDAFRQMAQGRHTGKIVLQIQDRLDSEPSGHASESRALSPHHTYLITGGLGGLGLEMAEWLIARGCRHLVLMARARTHPIPVHQIQAWSAAGLDVRVIQADVSRPEQLKQGLRKCRKMPPIKGVFHCAGLLDDGILLQQNSRRFIHVFAPKVMGAWHLQQHLKTLDFFVLFSSVSGLLGTPGQGNYAAANAFLDGLAAHRKAHGLPALSIAWGPFSETGMAARAMADAKPPGGILDLLSPHQGMQIMELLLNETASNLAAFQVHTQGPEEKSSCFVPKLLAPLVATRAGSIGSSRAALLLESFLQAPETERLEKLILYLQELVADSLQLKPEEVDVHRPLPEIGMDSLMGLELVNKVEGDLKIQVPLVGLMDTPTITDIGVRLMAMVDEAQQQGAVPQGAEFDDQTPRVPLN